MTKVFATATAILVFASLCVAAPARAQSGTKTEVVFTDQRKKEARQQLRRILSAYDLDPWIITREVRIEAGTDPHSKPILTLNTRYLDDDEKQLSIFLHEQAHWIPVEKRKAAVEELQEMYPEIPGVPKENQNYAGTTLATYNHLVVAWIELDAMTELVGEERARQIMRERVQELVEKPYGPAEKSFVWYNNRVLEDAREIGQVLATHGLVVTPKKGVVVETNEE